mmetsp:Transcript_66470/g.182322  ORF Transcript_66470/g.182322 Transcript_66470/m.182322 type:complete len:225 (-) Transcript_66470:662-1336(-)
MPPSRPLPWAPSLLLLPSRACCSQLHGASSMSPRGSHATGVKRRCGAAAASWPDERRSALEAVRAALAARRDGDGAGSATSRASLKRYRRAARRAPVGAPGAASATSAMCATVRDGANSPRMRSSSTALAIWAAASALATLALTSALVRATSAAASSMAPREAWSAGRSATSSRNRSGYLQSRCTGRISSESIEGAHAVACSAQSRVSSDGRRRSRCSRCRAWK